MFHDVGQKLTTTKNINADVCSATTCAGFMNATYVSDHV